MLKQTCQEFQRRYERGLSDEHPEGCAECRQFVEFVDSLQQLGLSAPLADDLRARLRRLPQENEGTPIFPRLPELPLPAALEHRLRRIAREGLREALPIWIRSPRYAIAASYLLTLLISGTVGNPAAWAEEAGVTVGSAWTLVHANGRDTWSGIEEGAVENIALTKDFLRASKSSLRARWIGLVESFNDPESNDDMDDTADGVDVEPDVEASI